ncbi:MAG: carbohydrate ABC transporter permease [Treponema sp.]|nr:carbohydrate ABC transporter permease [Treponema sp.]MBQ7166927.1 carbohydrate ABC transporter permease [Treponema sp.]
MMQKGSAVRHSKGYPAGVVISNAVKYFILVFFAFWTLIPLVSCLITAFKTDAEYQSTSVMMLPKVVHFQNFVKAFASAHMGRAFLNSGIVLVFVLALSIMISAQLAYVLNRFKFRGNTLIRNLFLFATLLPGVAMQVSVYKIMGTLGFINHLYGYIIMMCGTDVITIYIFIQFMENIPTSLDESGIMDGANYFTIFWRLILPLLKPAIVTSMILKGVGCYNEYYSANLYLQSEKLRTVAISLYTFTGPMGSRYNLICAGVIISLIPALIVFLLCQKQIYTGITAGAVKG